MRIQDKPQWTPIENKILLGFHQSGATAASLVETFGRTEQGIIKQSIKQGVKLGVKNKKDINNAL